MSTYAAKLALQKVIDDWDGWSRVDLAGDILLRFDVIQKPKHADLIAIELDIEGTTP